MRRGTELGEGAPLRPVVFAGRAAWRALPVLFVFAFACGRSALREDMQGESHDSGPGPGSGCAELASAVPDAGALQLSQGPYTTFQLTLHNHCAETLWPAWGRTGGLDQTVPDPSLLSPLAPGASNAATIHYVVDLEIGFWGRTRCSFDVQGKGACETGDCGGFVCPIVVSELPHDATIFAFGIGYLAGFNVPMLVTTPGCEPRGCAFELATCPEASRAVGACGAVVACDSVCPSSCCHPGANGCFDGGDVDVTFCP